MVSAPVDFHQMIPPNSSEFVTVAHCMPQCTNIYDFPEEGITAYNAFLHAHTSGTLIYHHIKGSRSRFCALLIFCIRNFSARKMRIRHFRGGKELPWIVNDENYNFNYQTNRRFPQPIKIMKGDQITAGKLYQNFTFVS
jgi:hypothetical protein